MKYLLVIALVWVAFLLWRHGRRMQLRSKMPPTARAPKLPEAMERCAHCGLHFPAADAVQGRHGSYCSDAHRKAAEP